MVIKIKNTSIYKALEQKIGSIATFVALLIFWIIDVTERKWHVARMMWDAIRDIFMHFELTLMWIIVIGFLLFCAYLA